LTAYKLSIPDENYNCVKNSPIFAANCLSKVVHQVDCILFSTAKQNFKHPLAALLPHYCRTTTETIKLAGTPDGMMNSGNVHSDKT